MLIVAGACDGNDGIRCLIMVIQAVAQRVAGVNSSWRSNAGGAGREGLLGVTEVVRLGQCIWP